MYRQELLDWCAGILEISKFQDYAPNGLQVEGDPEIKKIVCAVSASEAAIDATIAAQADTLLVHHGMFWKSEPVGILGWKKNRIKKILQHNINLIAYHLPLDAHPVLGNNAQLAKMCGWNMQQQIGEQGLLALGELKEPESLDIFCKKIQQILGRSPLIISNDDKYIRRIAWCTGGAQSFFQLAINQGVDLFLTGEVSEAQYHIARETDVVFVSAGHYATEKFGILALTKALEEVFEIESVYFDEPNPV